MMIHAALVSVILMFSFQAGITQEQTCAAAGITECCPFFSQCNLQNNGCLCDAACFVIGSCCDDIVDICLFAGIIAQDLEFIVEEGETEDVCVFVDTTSFTLTREVTITLTIENGTAENGTDFTGFADTTLTFPAGTVGSQVRCVDLLFINDNVLEGIEKVVILASSSDFGVVIPQDVSKSDITIHEGNGSCAAAGFQGCCVGASCDIGQCHCDAVCYDQNDCCSDIPNTCLPVLIPSEIEVNESDDYVTVCAVGSTGVYILTKEVIINAATNNDTALDGEDFQGLTANLTFTPHQFDASGLARVCVNISLLEDILAEDSEIFVVEFFAGQDVAFLEGDNAAVFIGDNDDIDVSLEQVFYVLPEDSISANLALYVCAAITNIDPRDAGTFSKNITVGLSTSPGSAQENEDYLAIQEVLVFTDPRVPQCVCIPPLQDSLVEGNETFIISITSVLDGVSSGAAAAEVIILDDDRIEFNFQQLEYTVEERDATSFLRVCVERTVIAQVERDNITLQLTTRDGTAIAGEDYEALNMTLLFATSTIPEVCVNITILYDNVPEGDEGFFLDLRSGDTAVVINSGGETSFVNILDDDGLQVQFEQNQYVVSESVGVLPICIRLTGGVQRQLTLMFSTQDGSATGSTDYTPAMEQLQLTDFNSTSDDNGPTLVTCVGVEILDDSTVETAELFFITLFTADPPGAALPTFVSVVIKDNDGFTPLSVRFINDSPQVDGDEVTVFFAANIPLQSAVCVLTTQREQNCISGVAVFSSLLPNRRRQYTFSVNVTSLDGQTKVLERTLRTETAGVCSAHLINDGVTINGNSVVVEWQGTGPSAQNRTNTFQCILGDGPMELCNSPYSTCVSPGDHVLLIRPNSPKEEECDRRVGLPVQFTV